MSIKKCKNLLLLMIHRAGIGGFDFGGQGDVGVAEYKNRLAKNESEIEKLRSEIARASLLRHGCYIDNNSLAAAIYEKLGPEVLDELMAIASEIEWVKKAL